MYKEFIKINNHLKARVSHLITRSGEYNYAGQYIVTLEVDYKYFIDPRYLTTDIVIAAYFNIDLDVYRNALIEQCNGELLDGNVCFETMYDVNRAEELLECWLLSMKLEN